MVRATIPLLAGVLSCAAGAGAAQLDKAAKGCEEGKQKECEKLAKPLSEYGLSDQKTSALVAEISRLPYKAALLSIARNGDARDVFRAAALAALKDPALAAQVAGDPKASPTFRGLAARQVEDQALLFKLAADKSQPYDVRAAAQETLTDVVRVVELIDLSGSPFTTLTRVADLPDSSLTLTPEGNARLADFAKGPPGLRADVAKSILAGGKPYRWATLDLAGPVFLVHAAGDVTGVRNASGRTVVRMPPGTMRFMARYHDQSYESKSDQPVSARFEDGRCYVAKGTVEGMTWTPAIVEEPCPPAPAR
jgi:hypothetical protein